MSNEGCFLTLNETIKKENEVPLWFYVRLVNSQSQFKLTDIATKQWDVLCLTKVNESTQNWFNVVNNNFFRGQPFRYNFSRPKSQTPPPFNEQLKVVFFFLQPSPPGRSDSADLLPSKRCGFSG